MPYKLKDRQGRWRGSVQVDGQRIFKDFPNKKEAKVWEEETRKALKDPLSQKKIHGDIDFHSTAVDYLDYVRDRYQLKTYSEKRLIIASFESFLGQNIQIGLIDEKQIIDYLSSVKNKISANAANVHRKNLLAFWNWAVKYGGLRYNPVALVDKFPHDVQIQYTPPEADVLKVLAAARGQDQVLLETYIHTGARRSEVFRLTWDDINFEKKQIRLGVDCLSMISQ